MTPLNKYIIDTKGLVHPNEVLKGKYIKCTSTNRGIFKIICLEGKFKTFDHVHYRVDLSHSWELICSKDATGDAKWSVNRFDEPAILSDMEVLLYA